MQKDSLAPCWRHEIKYFIRDTQAEVLKARLSGIMQLDGHVMENGKYQIKSLYFDDIYDTNYYENENGVNPREKFRIRTYNGDTSHIWLERKKKDRGKTLKQKCPLTAEQYEDIVCRGIVRGEDALLAELSVAMRTRRMRPKVIIMYERVPYIYRDGNVRITFDENIMSSNALGSFLGQTKVRRPVLPAGTLILEQKYDAFLPDHIRHCMQTDHLQQCTFSKYYLGRKFSTGGREDGFFRYF